MVAVPELFNLAGRVAVVTGAGSGLGHHFAVGLAEAGADVALLGRRQDRLEATARRLEALGQRALVLPTDVRDPVQVQSAVQQTLENLGAVHILVNNVGIHIRGSVVAQSLEDWNSVLATNLTSTFLLCQTVGPHMIQQRRGRIINIGSVYGVVGRDGAAYDEGGGWLEALGYATTKGGIINLTRELSANWAHHGITVNTLSPGMFGNLDETGQHEERPLYATLAGRTPLGRMGNADDLKGALVFLASDAAAFITGQNLLVDGGWTAW